MTLNEFSAWLDGYRASFVDGVPSKEQWFIIKRKIDSVTTSPQFVAYGTRPDDTMTRPYGPIGCPIVTI